MQDTKISNYKLDERDILTFKVTIKEWDYTVAERELLKNATKNWDTLDIDIVWLVSWDEEKYKKSKLQQLALNMQTYCDKANESIEAETNKLYLKYKVNSRKQMNIEDITKEIETYKMWIFEFTS